MTSTVAATLLAADFQAEEPHKQYPSLERELTWTTMFPAIHTTVALHPEPFVPGVNKRGGLTPGEQTLAEAFRSKACEAFEADLRVIRGGGIRGLERIRGTRNGAKGLGL